jgi:2-methylisocitrate lyase-like PEP mutase family enzyme
MNQRQVAAAASKAQALRALHGAGRMLVLPNVWDAASARAVEAAGFPAVATSSAAVVLALGYEDHERAPVNEMLRAAARIVEAVSVPVTVDFEAGYQLSPEEIARDLIGIGAAGFNLEDTDHRAGGTLADAEAHAKHLAAIKRALRAADVDLVLNARVDVFVHRAGTHEEQLAEGLRRARLYRQAGADCIYPILLTDESSISAFVDAVGVVNINTRRGGPLTLERLSALGVRRVSYAASLFRDTVAMVESFVGEIKAQTDSLPL